jgi:hypothetical protein
MEMIKFCALSALIFSWGAIAWFFLADALGITNILLSFVVGMIWMSISMAVAAITVEEYRG